MVFTTRPIKSYNIFYSVERLLELKFFDITPALILIVTYKSYIITEIIYV